VALEGVREGCAEYSASATGLIWGFESCRGKGGWGEVALEGVREGCAEYSASATGLKWGFESCRGKGGLGKGGGRGGEWKEGGLWRDYPCSEQLRQKLSPGGAAGRSYLPAGLRGALVKALLAPPRITSAGQTRILRKQNVGKPAKRRYSMRLPRTKVAHRGKICIKND